MNRLDGKAALITGGARGMGAAEAALFVDAGATVIITDVDASQGEAVAESIGPSCQFLPHDVASESDWSRVVGQIEADHGHINLKNAVGLLSGAFAAPGDRLIRVLRTVFFRSRQALGAVLAPFL